MYRTFVQSALYQSVYSDFFDLAEHDHALQRACKNSAIYEEKGNSVPAFFCSYSDQLDMFGCTASMAET